MLENIIVTVGNAIHSMTNGDILFTACMVAVSVLSACMTVWAVAELYLIWYEDKYETLESLLNVMESYQIENSIWGC